MQHTMPTYMPRPRTQSFPLPSLRLLWILIIFSVMAGVTVSEIMLLAVQPPRNPFADYAALMPGQSEKAAIEHGFTCAPDYTGATCTDKTSAGAQSEVYLSVSHDHVIESISFVTHGNTLKFGDLVALWGRPTCEMRGSLVVMVCWRGVYALVPLRGQQDVTYFSPVKLVEFADYAVRGCSEGD